ncbi:fasciclin domain-containing protein [Coleofasciculus sp. FACHB-1120]|uniref:fasciclin domain-containing protein n=1 Tax=Coleofasciculus sp. FACHB-1120 TaxID=2692783 RepID=UPI0016866CE1|nr:fasciclin domain-containing protein [Coleofasciculus sp. FACHB-1120]MBD2741078.1 fasciclin domain-containing protein [Coleofasciculus sp. FACHB-1120]
MPINSSSPVSKKLTALISLLGLGVLITLPALAHSKTSFRVSNAQFGSRSRNQPQSLSTTGNLDLLARILGVRNIALELETSSDAFSTLSVALKKSGLNDTFSGRQPYTIFAPTDEAFAALPRGTLQALLRPENKAKLIKILTYHVVPGEITSMGAKSGRVRTLAGQPVTMRVSPNQEITVNGAKVILADIPASNGVIHGINKVLLPPGF